MRAQEKPTSSVQSRKGFALLEEPRVVFVRDFSARHLVTLHHGERERRARNALPVRSKNGQQQRHTNQRPNERERDFAFVHRTITTTFTTPIFRVPYFPPSLALLPACVEGKYKQSTNYPTKVESSKQGWFGTVRSPTWHRSDSSV